MIGYISGSDKAVSNYVSSQQTNTAGDLLFEKISDKIGADGTKITKDQVENYVLNSQFASSDTKGDAQVEFLNTLLAKWDHLSGGSDSITQTDFTSGLGYLLNQKSDSSTTTSTNTLITETDSKNELYYDGETSSITASFETLAAAIGAVGGKITKEQLLAFLQTLESDSSDSENVDFSGSNKDITFVKKLIAQFDSISKGGDYITSLVGLEDPQDYSTITTEQVTPPIDIKI